MFLSREQLLQKRPRRTQDVEIPQLGKVRVQEMTAKERGQLEARVTRTKKDQRQVRQWIVIFSVVDQDGNRMFSPADLDRLGQLGSGTIEPIVNAAQDINRFSDDDIEDLEKNSETIPDGSSL